MDLFEIGGLSPQHVFGILIFILCIRYIEQDYYLVPLSTSLNYAIILPLKQILEFEQFVGP
jgi:hypothetical protein